MSTDDIVEGDVPQQLHTEPRIYMLSAFLDDAKRFRCSLNENISQLQKDMPLARKHYAIDSLRFKIANQWHRINKGSEQDVLEILLELLESNEEALIVKTCECLATFILQTVTKYDTIHVLIKSFQCEDDDWTKRNLLETLALVPIQLYNVSSSEFKKCDLVKGLTCCSRPIFSLIYNLLSDKSSQDFLKNQALKCFKNWLIIDVAIFNKKKELIYWIFEHLRQPACFTCSAEALKQFFKLFKPMQRYNTTLHYLNEVCKLSPLFDSALDDIDVTRGLTEIIVSAAMNNIDIILISFDNSFYNISWIFLELVLKTINIKAQYPIKEHCSNLSFDFWVKLQTNSESYLCNGKDVIDEKILQIVEIMIDKTKYPHENEYNNWEYDTKEKFICYRQECAKTAASFSKFLGCKPIKRMLNKLSNLCDSHRKGTGVEWQEFESIFHMMISTVKVALKEMDCNEEIHDLLIQVPCTHNTLRKQIIFFLGSYAEQTDYQMFKYSINFILESLRISETSSVALMFLNALILHKKDRFYLVKENVIQGLKECMDAGYLETSDYSLLAKCLACLLPLMAQDEALNLIQVFLMPQFDDLINANSNMISFHNKNDFVQKLKMLSGFFAGLSLFKVEMLDSSHFIFRFLEQLFPCIIQVINLNILHANTIDDLFKMSQRSTSSNYFSFSAQRCWELVSTAYSFNPIPCLFNLAKSLISSGDQTPITQSSSDLIHKKSFPMLEHASENQIAMLKEFLDSSRHILTKLPMLLTCESIDLLKLLSAVIVGISNGDNSLNRSSCRFLDSLISKIDPTQIIEVHGRKLLEVIVFAILETRSENNLKLLARAVKILLVQHFDFMTDTLNEMLSDDKFQVSDLSILEKKQLLCKIITPAKGRINVERVILGFAKIRRKNKR